LGIIVALYLLLDPVIKILAWISLFGSLRSAAPFFAAAIVALILGLSLSCLIIALAWVM